MTQRALLLGVCALLGCSAPASEGGVSSGGSEAGSEASTAGPAMASGSTSSLGATSLASSDSTDSTTGGGSSEGGSFIDPTGCGVGLPDGTLAHCPTVECSLFDQDCNRGETCRAWANDGGSRWNAARCSSVQERPGQVGEPCSVEASPLSGIDSCDVGLMCWHVDPDTLEGECVAYCEGSLLEPGCADKGEGCLLFEDGALPLCLPPCDPLALECGEGQTCAWTSNDAFGCVRDDFVPCPDGTRHYPPGEGPSICAEDRPCCVPYCNTSEPSTCPDGLSCQPFYLQPNPDHPDLGLCWPFGG